MNPLSRITGKAVDRALGFAAPAVPYVLRRDVPVPMPDGVVLLGDHYRPAGPDRPLPVVLIRSPYGRGGASILFAAPLRLVPGRPAGASVADGEAGGARTSRIRCQDRSPPAAHRRPLPGAGDERLLIARRAPPAYPQWTVHRAGGDRPLCPLSTPWPRAAHLQAVCTPCGDGPGPVLAGSLIGLGRRDAECGGWL